MQNPWQTLEISEGATPQEAKAAYYRLAKKLHPDNPDSRSIPDAEERLKKVNEAYRLITSGEASSGSKRFETDFEDICSEIFGVRPRASSNRSSSAARGADIHRTLTISLEEAFRGGAFSVGGTSGSCGQCSGSGRDASGKTVSCDTCGGLGTVKQRSKHLHINVECPACSGIGTVSICRSCGGSGRADAAEAEIKLQPGCEDGFEAWLEGMGGKGSGGGNDGDLLVTVKVECPPGISVKGAHLLHRVPLLVSEAALGTTKEVRSIDGKTFRLKIPSGTQHGHKFRIPRQGMPVGGGRGDLIAEIAVTVPSEITPDLRAALEKLQNLGA